MEEFSLSGDVEKNPKHVRLLMLITYLYQMQGSLSLFKKFTELNQMLMLLQLQLFIQWFVGNDAIHHFSLSRENFTQFSAIATLYAVVHLRLCSQCYFIRVAFKFFIFRKFLVNLFSRPPQDLCPKICFFPSVFFLQISRDNSFILRIKKK